MTACQYACVYCGAEFHEAAEIDAHLDDVHPDTIVFWDEDA